MHLHTLPCYIFSRPKVLDEQKSRILLYVIEQTAPCSSTCLVLNGEGKSCTDASNFWVTMHGTQYFHYSIMVPIPSHLFVYMQVCLYRRRGESAWGWGKFGLIISMDRINGNQWSIHFLMDAVVYSIQGPSPRRKGIYSHMSTIVLIAVKFRT